ncbi:MAG: preprotein translocase subunit SecG [Clostridia bacterium]|jgi:preprotein translocase subunit SecG|nr:preprotein translocase subunit SecG [Clostridia bacterium]MCI1999451.1 preprotein translocase subunit SecG [Clostridia bacterium]MCI2015047.1 preprotein translocase subunit SecG [Clostridia bacterium]
MSTLATVLSIIMAILGVLLCAIILLQSNRAAGLGAIGGGSSNSDSYWSKNKGNSVEGSLARYTKIGGAIFIILGIVINYIH